MRSSGLAFLLRDFGDGGVERMAVNTCNALDVQGMLVERLVAHATVPFLERLDPAVGAALADGILAAIDASPDSSHRIAAQPLHATHSASAYFRAPGPGAG